VGGEEEPRIGRVKRGVEQQSDEKKAGWHGQRTGWGDGALRDGR
jgi:hypothetical protein